MLSSGRGESVSTSDVAKILLESAREDRLDFRLEVAELQQDPTAALVAIRRKWELKEAVARSEWVFLSQYIQVATEDLSKVAMTPPAAAFIALLEALLGVRGLRTDRGTGLDLYYLGNLGAPEGGLNERQLDPELVPRTVARLVAEMRQNPASPKPLQAGRCFYVALRDESIADLVAISRVLEPQMSALFRLAARGHWMREHRPVRPRREEAVIAEPLPELEEKGFRLSGNVNAQGEVSLSLAMAQRNVLYPIGSYPEIREFATMLQELKPDSIWNGVHFYGFTTGQSTTAQLLFRRYRDGVMLGFSVEEWECLQRLMVAALGSPKLRRFWRELELVYGEL